MIATGGLPTRHAGLDRLEAAERGLDLPGEGCVQHGHANVVHAMGHLRISTSGIRVSRGYGTEIKMFGVLG